jgi:hypothetical protein
MTGLCDDLACADVPEELALFMTRPVIGLLSLGCEGEASLTGLGGEWYGGMGTCAVGGGLSRRGGFGTVKVGDP